MQQLLASVSAFENLNIKDKPTATTEIVIMLLGAFLLGYLVHWLICRGRGHAIPASKRATQTARSTTHQATSAKDDLKIVEGVGPRIEELLNGGGIHSYADLASASNAELQGILDDAGSRFQMHDPSSWPQQAALARDGRMEELDALKDKLVGGR
jgi:hypothetical protein